jgi:hypothetical protein
VEIAYEAWVSGFEEAGTRVGRDLRARVWKYAWPNWGLNLRTNARVAPVDVTARARMLSFRGQLENPEYVWELSGPGMQVVEDKWADMRTLQLTEPGSYTVTVSITDARGNHTVLEETLEVGEADPYEVSINYTASNEYLRAPVEIRMRPQVSGGHPRDRVQERIYHVNGELVESMGYGARVELGEGTHDVSLTIRTRMGEAFTESMVLDVKPNQPPVCEVQVEDRASSWRLHAACEDPDGRMRTYEWTVNGEPVSVRSNRLTLQKSVYSDVLPTVEVVGFDDAGGASQPARAQ